MNLLFTLPLWKRFSLLFLFLIGVTILFFFPEMVFAADLLQGSQKSLEDTIMGTGKLFIYLIEAIIAIALYIKTRNLMVFLGVIIIAVFIEIITKKFLGA